MVAKRGLGRLILAAGVIGLGAIVVRYGDASLVWESKTAARQPALADIAGAGLLMLGVGLLLPLRFAMTAAWALVLLLSGKILILCIPALLRHLATELTWYAPAEALALAAGPLAVAAAGGAPTARIARYAFGLALIPIGLSHLVYLALTASLVPAWLPLRPGLAIATGACHLAAGAAVLIGVVPRLAARLEAAMMSIFTALVWAPAVIAKPAIADNWSELFLSIALSGAAWLVAEVIFAKEGIPFRPPGQFALDGARR